MDIFGLKYDHPWIKPFILLHTRLLTHTSIVPIYLSPNGILAGAVPSLPGNAHSRLLGLSSPSDVSAAGTMALMLLTGLAAAVLKMLIHFTYAST